MKENSLNIDHLKTVDLTTGDLRDIVQVFEVLTSMFVLPTQAVEAMDRLTKKVTQG
jgi:hypothetical protein